MRWRWCSCVAVTVAVAVVIAAVIVGATRDEDVGDTAAFAVSVADGAGAGARCGGAMVALRAALTAARCARAPELWVRAAGSGASAAAVRVLRVAVAGGGIEEKVRGAEREWEGVGADLALLELEETVRGTRAIIAAGAGAGAGGECEQGATCHVPRVRAQHLRVVPVALEAAAQCAGRGRALCLLGARLCADDRGSAVVCGGVLCGVVSRPAYSPRDMDKGQPCGERHAAASVPRAHRFMRCAMLRGACGRGECESVCVERWLHGEPPNAPHSPASAGESETEVVTEGVSTVTVATSDATSRGGGGGGGELSLATRTALPAWMEFEPNPADFKVTPARTSAVWLEGDAPPTRTPAPHVLRTEVEARVSSATTLAPFSSRAPRPRQPLTLLLLLLLLLPF